MRAAGRGFEVTIWGKDAEGEYWTPIPNWNTRLLRIYTEVRHAAHAVPVPRYQYASALVASMSAQATTPPHRYPLNDSSITATATYLHLCRASTTTPRKTWQTRAWSARPARNIPSAAG